MTYYEYLVGVSHRPPAAQGVVLALQIGDQLILEREPDNAYDENAIKVIEPESGVFIGYIGRETAAVISPLLALSPEYDCVVFSNVQRKKPYLAISIDYRHAGGLAQPLRVDRQGLQSAQVRRPLQGLPQ
jgi:hypothetical protein